MQIKRIWCELPKDRQSLMLDPDSHIRHGFAYPAKLSHPWEYDCRIKLTIRWIVSEI